MAPPTRLASRASSSRGPRTRRARTRTPNPGASRSIRACIRSANRSQSSWSHAAGCPRPPASRGRLLRHVRVGPHRLGAGGRPGGVGGGHLAGQQERPAGIAPRRDLAERLGHLLDGVGDVHRARRAVGPVAHGTGPSSAQSTFTVPGSSWKRAHRPHDRARAGRSSATSPPYRWVATTSASTARRGGDRSPSAVRRRPRGRRRPRPAAPRRRHRISPPAVQPAASACGELAGAAHGHGEADRLAEHRQQSAHQTRSPGESSGMSAWPALPASSSRAAGAGETLAAEVGGRGEHRPDEVEAADRAQPASAAEAGAHRRERRERAPSTSWSPIAVPVRAQLEPGRAVAGVLLVEHRRAVTSRSRCRIAHCPSGERMPEHGRARAPTSARAPPARRTGSSRDAAASG